MIAPIDGFCNNHIEGPERVRKLAVKMRLDQALLARGLAGTRSQAQDLIRRGVVRLRGQIIRKTGYGTNPEDPIEVTEIKRYVSRSAWKLAAAIGHFSFSPDGRVCLDAGSSTGGFAQVLLEGGAARIYAADIGHGQLHPSLRARPEIISMEGTDARSLTPDLFHDRIDAVTCDVSFISVLKVLPALSACAQSGAWLVALVKPQFEVGKRFVGKGGIVKDEAAKAEAARRVAALLAAEGWTVHDALASPISGQDGNEETLIGAIRG